MNLNPFKQISDEDKETNAEKKAMHKQISKQAFEIAKKVPIMQCKREDVTKLEVLYKEYFKKFPDAQKEKECKNRIAKLRKII